MRSVPAETKLAAVCTKTLPARARGAGTSLTVSPCDFKACITCFMNSIERC
jgi:hypothetical protein